jgi:hypothetical protein
MRGNIDYSIGCAEGIPMQGIFPDLPVMKSSVFEKRKVMKGVYRRYFRMINRITPGRPSVPTMSAEKILREI